MNGERGGQGGSPQDVHALRQEAGRSEATARLMNRALSECLDERLELALRGGDIGFWDWNVGTGEVVINQRWVETLGFSPEETSQNISELENYVHPEDASRRKAGFNAHLEGRTPLYECEYRLRTKSGRYKWILSRGKVVERDAAGNAIHMLGVHVDITERMEAEEGLKKSERKLRGITTNAQDGIIMMDNAGCISFWNPAAEKMFGWSEADALGKEVHDLIAPDRYRTEWEKGLVDFERTGQGPCVGRVNRYSARRKDGTEFPVELSVASVQLDQKWHAIGIVRDVSEKYAREEELKTHLKFLNTLLDTIPSPIFYKDRQGIYQGCNSAFAERILGLSKEEIVGSSLYDFPERIPRELADVYHRQDLDLMAQGGVQVYEAQVLCSDNVRRDFMFTKGTFCDAQGDVAGIVGVMLDVSDRRQVEQELRFQGMLLDQIRENITATDLDGRITYVNRASVQSLGRSKEEIIGQTTELYGEDAERGPTHREIVRKTLDEGEWRGEIVNYFPDRSPSVMDLHTWIFDDEQGNPVGLCGTATDVTERKRTEEALRTSEKKYRQLYESMTDAFASVDMEGRIVEFNTTFADMLGYSFDEIRKLTYNDITPERWHAAEAEIVEGQVFARGYSDVYEKEYLRKDGTVFPVELRAFLLRDDAGQPVGMWAIVRDITDRKRAREELARARDEALAGTQAKSEFLARMSHEIRTPMNGVLGMVELLLDTELEPEQREYLDAVKESADSLLAILNDILDFSKIEAGKLELTPIRFHLRKGVKALTTLLSVRMDEKNIDYSVTIAEDIPDILVGDVNRLQQILINLLGNAIKFTEPGGRVSLGVHQEGRSEQGIGLHFVVSDSGIGISKEQQERIFDSFCQADSTLTREYRGTGLGLTIAKGLVELMGGQMSMVSEMGEGSSFYFTVPVGVWEEGGVVDDGEPGEIGEASAETIARPLRVLLVDDNPANQKLGLWFLEKDGHEVVLARDGKEAVECWDAESFDVVFMDVQMPIMDGYEAAREIRSREQGSGRHTPIIAMTAHAMSGDREKCLAAGMDDYIPKPVARKQLREKLRALRTGRS